jgi:hypothetical protein
LYQQGRLTHAVTVHLQLRLHLSLAWRQSDKSCLLSAATTAVVCRYLRRWSSRIYAHLHCDFVAL